MENLCSLTLFFSSFISLSLFLDSAMAADTLTLKQSLSNNETLLSADETFELGFLSLGSSNRYLGIWYKKTPSRVVWVANRNNPITDSYGVLSISNNGDLVLLNQSRGRIWYANISSSLENPVAQLLNSGNLVVRENRSTSSERFLWQSFDYPSDTLLPDMKISWNMKSGQQRYLTSWKSSDDPSDGGFTYKVDKKELPQLVIFRGSTKKFRTGLWNGVRFGGVPSLPNTIFKPVMGFDGNEWSYRFEPNNKEIASVITISQSGSVQRLTLDGGSTEWTILYSVPNEPCNMYGNCGANGICRVSKSPICECLQGFIPKSLEEWQAQIWTNGCIRRKPLDCHSGDKFKHLVGVKLPDLLEFSLTKSMNLEECRAECLKNCSCTAYASSDIRAGGSGCLVWYGDLIDMREFLQEDSEQDIYIRLAASELESTNNSMRRKITIMVVAIVFGTSILVLFWCLIWRRKTNRRGLVCNKKEHIDLPLFDFATIATATNSFSHTRIVGEGGFGPVYKGSLSTGEDIAVKRLSKNSGQGPEEFKNEVVLIAKLQHKNLVSLLGCCIKGEERMLIYEYMTHKSLDQFIFDPEKGTLLDWEKRFNLILGIARGLLYLHQDSKLQIIHRDLKPSNILLDNNMIPKISDFGLARIFGGDEVETRTKKVVGTYGYMSPEYAIDGKFSVKSDVFSFGVILLEVVSGKKNRGFSHSQHHHSLLGHAWLLWNEEETLDLMDSNLKNSCVESQVLRCIQVGLLCVQKLPMDRPTMASVVFMLANEGARLPLPKQPAFFLDRNSIDEDSKSKKEESYTRNETSTTLFEGR